MVVVKALIFCLPEINYLEEKFMVILGQEWSLYDFNELLKKCHCREK